METDQHYLLFAAYCEGRFCTENTAGGLMRKWIPGEVFGRSERAYPPAVNTSTHLDSLFLALQQFSPDSDDEDDDDNNFTLIGIMNIIFITYFYYWLIKQMCTVPI